MKKEKASSVQLQLVNSPSKRVIKGANGNIPNTVGISRRYLTLIPSGVVSASTTTPTILSVPIRLRNGTRGIFSGKGKYGKRPATYAIDFGGHSNDNSNDSGLDCDNSNSDSQFWGSSEDLRSIGLVATRRSSSAAQLNGAHLLQLPIQRSGPEKEMVPVDLERAQPIFGTGIDCTFTSTNQIVNGDTVDKKVLTFAPAPTDVKSVSPDTTVVTESDQNSTSVVSSSLANGQHSKMPSTVPVKRARFNFQTPAVPVRPASALRLRNQNQPPNIRGNLGKRLPLGSPPTLSSNITTTSRDGTVQLQILAQPEEQHRARYQTEGSRGAIKDRKGNGFPAVKLVGYDKPATLQIFIGSDQGKVQPHMFYQACKVTGKSSTPCTEKKVEGTVLIEIEFEQSKDMVISCDCVGILKERNVDVEQRFPFHHAASSRKKSTRCRLIFRTTIINSNGIQETLQVSSLPILCTQPPGQPEICKKSLSECSCKGGQELFIVGKNFLKDTKVVVQEETLDGDLLWEAKAEMLKDYVQQNHLICVLPPYKDENITKPVNCKVSVWSGGKLSEPHHLTYLPISHSVVYGVSSSASIVSSIDTQAQAQSLIQNSLQDQLTRSILNGDMSIPMMNAATEAAATSFMQESNAALVPMVQNPITTMASLNFETTMMAPVSSMQQERQVVSELQEILDQSSQQTMMAIGENSQAMPSGPTSFFGLNLVGPMPMEAASFQQAPVATQTSPISQATASTSPMNIFGELSSQQIQDMNNRRQSHPTIDPFDQASVTVTSSMPQLMSMVQPQQVESQLMCPMDTATDAVLSCISMTMKAEPLSPETPCSQQQQQNQQQEQSNPQIMNVISLMGGELQGEQGSIANALTQMSDNELLSYINPTCFEQDLK